jgi:hypothetical protein
MGRRRGLVALFVALAVPSLTGLLSTTMRAASESPVERWVATGKVHPELYRLERGDAPIAGVEQTQRTGSEDGGGYVTVSAVPSEKGRALLKDLEEIGLLDGAANAKMVTGRLPIEAIDAAGELDSVQFIRPEWAVRSLGPVLTQGDAQLKADVARTAFDVDGTGVTVGVLSDSFDCEDGYDDDKTAGELPDETKIQVISEGPCSDPLSPHFDEGRAMSQIIADVAPGATQKFHSAANGQLDYAQGIVELKDAGAKIITDDFGYLNEPWFLDGVIAQAVDTVTAAGVSYFPAAGNSGRLGYQSTFAETTFKPKDLTAAPVHDFDPGTAVDPTQRVTLPAQSIAFIGLQWDDNFKTQIPSMPAPLTDLDIYAFAPDATLLPILGLPGADPNKLSAFPGVAEQSRSLEPVEGMLIVNPESTAKPVDIVIPRLLGPMPTVLKWIEVTGSTMTVDEFATPNAGTIFGHSQALGAMSVGAASSLPSATPPVIEPYSAVGGAQILRDPKGVPIGADVVRARPAFVGPDNTNTSFFGEDSPDDTDSWPNFPGTSAAAPHAAAVAALALEKAPTATRDEICNALTSTAVDMGSTTGADNESGHGFIDANAALIALPLAATAAKSPRCSTVQLAIDSVTKSEGNSGVTKLSFKVTKLGATAGSVTVDYATADGTAKETEDYKKTTGTLTFAATDLTKTVDVDITGDTTKESDETFNLSVANVTPANVVLLNSTFGTATIKDDDNPASNTGDSTTKLDYVTFGTPSKTKAEPGDEVKIDGSGFEGDASLALSFHSTPVTLGSVTATTAGAFSTTITIPDTATNGAHEIHAVGTDAAGGTRTIRYAVTIVNGAPVSSGGSSTGGIATSGGEVVGSVTTTSALPTTTTTPPGTLPRTGGSITFFAELGTILLLVGAAATFGTRRRERPILGFDIRDL